MFKFDAKEDKAFKALKTRLSNHPILAIYCPAAKTELHCDASVNGFGVIPYCYNSKMEQYRISVTERHWRNLNIPGMSGRYICD